MLCVRMLLPMVTEAVTMTVMTRTVQRLLGSTCITLADLYPQGRPMTFDFTISCIRSELSTFVMTFKTNIVHYKNSNIYILVAALFLR